MLLVQQLPRGYRNYNWNGRPYYNYGGSWYRPYGSSYISIGVPSVAMIRVAGMRSTDPSTSVMLPV